MESHVSLASSNSVFPGSTFDRCSLNTTKSRSTERLFFPFWCPGRESNITCSVPVADTFLRFTRKDISQRLRSRHPSKKLARSQHSLMVSRAGIEHYMFSTRCGYFSSFHSKRYLATASIPPPIKKAGEKPAFLDGVQGGNRTRIALRLQNFKSCASTNFATRTCGIYYHKCVYKNIA